MQTKFKNVFILVFALVAISSCGPSRVVVKERPVAPYVVRTAPPYPNAVWIDGEWRRRGGRYQYVQPHYVSPRNGRAWVPGHWVTTRRGNVWVKGNWR